MTQHVLGDISIQRIVESICTDFDPLSFFPRPRPKTGRGIGHGWSLAHWIRSPEI